MTQQIIAPWRVLDANGDPVSGAKFRFFEAGTDTLLTVYTTEALSTPHPDPLVADSGGFAPRAFWSGTPAARLRIFDADDVQIFDIDPVASSSTSTGAANSSSCARGR